MNLAWLSEFKIRIYLSKDSIKALALKEVQTKPKSRKISIDSGKTSALLEETLYIALTGELLTRQPLLLGQGILKEAIKSGLDRFLYAFKHNHGTALTITEASFSGVTSDFKFNDTIELPES